MTSPRAGAMPPLTSPRPGRTRSASAENPTGRAGGGGRAEQGTHSTAYASRDLPRGWKKSPCLDLAGDSERTIIQIDGPGTIQHLWITTLPEHWRMIVLRFWWDDEPEPAIAVPLGDFFCMGWERYAPVSSMPVTVAPAGGLNCYWEMPFRTGARITVPRYKHYRAEGFRYFFGVDATTEAWQQRRGPYLRQARINVDGIRLKGNVRGSEKSLAPFFDSRAVMDPARPR